MIRRKVPWSRGLVEIIRQHKIREHLTVSHSELTDSVPAAKTTIDAHQECNAMVRVMQALCPSSLSVEAVTGKPKT